MKKISCTLIFLTFCILSFGQKEITAPKIISMVPEFGDCKVDPKLKEIILRFDQDMSPGHSVPDTKNQPQFEGKLHWIDSRTFSIPVKLYPGKLYSLNFNTSRFQNFRSVDGIPLNPVDLVFKTSSASYTEANKQSYEELLDLFPVKYSYAGLKDIDWKSLLEKNRKVLENAMDPGEFAIKLISLLKPANDPHMWIEFEGQRFETGKLRLVNRNYGTPLIPILKNCKTTSDFSSIAGIYDSISYICLRSWNTDIQKLQYKAWGNSQNPEIESKDVLRELLSYPYLIIDVRENMGGNEAFARTLASFFAADSIPYEKVIVYNEKSGKFDKEHIKKLRPLASLYNYSGKIYVLSGPSVLSSNESFILMMKSLPNATVIGMKTYGSSGNPQPYTLSNGVTVYIPSWQAHTLEGKLIEGNGVEPDIEIITNPEDFKKNDVLFEKVVKMIKEGK